ncbi:MAG: efflux RND transporter periplasmic adaptor subunit [Acidobacteria bacterium]|nr:efflux RND transporter periplasmic adaptor subunit [Acidobacteriota bacterium]
MRRALLVLALLAGGFGAGYLYHARHTPFAPKAGERRILYWYDAMHPAYKSDKPGIAPDCGMQLVPKYADEGATGHAAVPADPGRKALFYRDPQQPSFQSDRPGLNPETGNELVPVYEGDATTMAAGTVRITPDKQQLIGVRFGTAEYASESRTLHSAGKVTADETRISHVHTRTEGWIDHVYVHFTGMEVKQGEPLLTIYSPELLATQQEYLLALKARQTMKASPLESGRDHLDGMIEAAGRRLNLLNFSEEQIREITRTGKPIQNVTLYTPASGYITMRNAFHTQQVKPDVELYTIVDLSHVWIMADVFESDAPNVRVGTPARITLASLPGRVLAARVTYIQPQVNPETRTLKVRLEADNPGMLLKPEMFVDVDLLAPAPARLTGPSDAVLDAGERKTVFVDRGNGFFEPRQVQTGERYGDRIVILSGLKAGERIVTSGTFLIDSESQLKAAAAGMEHKHD